MTLNSWRGRNVAPLVESHLIRKRVEIMINQSIVKYLHDRAQYLAELGQIIKAAELLAIADRFQMESE